MPDMPATHDFNKGAEMQWMPKSSFVHHEKNHKGPGKEPDPKCPFCIAKM